MGNFLKKWFTGLTTGTTTATEFETNVQDRLLAIEERLALEHQTFKNDDLNDALTTSPGRHKAGAVSVCYMGTSAPTSPPPTLGSIYYNTNTLTFYVYNGSTWLAQTVPTGVPSGTIVMWYDSPANIPSGWTLLTAFNRKFPMGADNGAGYPAGASAGTGPTITHDHGIANAIYSFALFGTTILVSTATATNPRTLTVPYYAVYFIRKD
jgi:hypothetical protein